jgi:hypothetical protein
MSSRIQRLSLLCLHCEIATEPRNVLRLLSTRHLPSLLCYFVRPAAFAAFLNFHDASAFRSKHNPIRTPARDKLDYHVLNVQLTADALSSRAWKRSTLSIRQDERG